MLFNLFFPKATRSKLAYVLSDYSEVSLRFPSQFHLVFNKPFQLGPE